MNIPEPKAAGSLEEAELCGGIERYTTELLLLLVDCSPVLTRLISNVSRFLTKGLSLSGWIKGSVTDGNPKSKLLFFKEHFTQQMELQVGVSKHFQLKSNHQDGLRSASFEVIRSGAATKYEVDCINQKCWSVSESLQAFLKELAGQLLVLKFSAEAIDVLVSTALQDSKSDSSCFPLGRTESNNNSDSSLLKTARSGLDYVSRLKVINCRLKEMRSQVVKAHLKLVISIAKRYRKGSIAVGDLVQEGNVGLLKAMDKFERQRGVKFSTYAAWWVRQSVSQFVVLGSQVVKTNSLAIETLSKAQETIEDEMSQLGNEDNYLCPSLPTDNLLRGNANQAAEMESDADVRSNLGESISEILDWLPEREARIVKLRFGLGDERKHTLEEIGRQLGVTRERVRQIEARALKKMRHPKAPGLSHSRQSYQVRRG